MIQTRRELAQHLQSQMVASSGSWLSASEEERPGRTRVKTYLLEAHPTGGDHVGLLTELGEKLGLDVTATQERDLFTLRCEGVEAWCDLSVGRFWKLHTTAPVKDSDQLHKDLLRVSPLLDAVWVPPAYLEAFHKHVGARLLTFSLHHDRRRLNRELSGDADYVSLRLFALRASKTLQKVRDANIFPDGVSIRSVQLRSGGDEPDDDYCVAEYFSHGKITVTGTSFAEHTRLLTRALRDYQALVEGIEERYGLLATVDADGHPVVQGDPVQIRLRWTASDLEYAVGRMFSGTEPFRLWAMPERLGVSRFRARAVDLHVGSVLTFDITPDCISILLPRGVCGNTIVRFLGALRYSVNAEAELVHSAA